jgi:endonuclease YncB( thermonuclease family)
MESAMRRLFHSGAGILALSLSLTPFAASGGPASSGEVYSGTVVAVIDGGSFRLARDEGGEIRVRLAGIDSPAPDEAFGVEARGVLRALVLGHRVVVESASWDRGYLIGEVRRDGDSDGGAVRERLLRQGLARLDGETGSARLKAMEDAARRDHRGLWGGPKAQGS